MARSPEIAKKTYQALHNYFQLVKNFCILTKKALTVEATQKKSMVNWSKNRPILKRQFFQNPDDEKFFFCSFRVHMMVKFQKSQQSSLLQFVRVHWPYQPHVFGNHFDRRRHALSCFILAQLQLSSNHASLQAYNIFVSSDLRNLTLKIKWKIKK